MSKKISGAEFPLAKIFSSDFEYLIPSYQRPYAWTTDQSSELFDDLYDFFRSEEEEGYFLGSIVLIKEEGSPKSEVIDGQQRLTTLTILLAAIAAQLEGEDRLTLSQYITEPGNKFAGLKPKPRLTLREKDREFFTCYVQGLAFNDLLALGPASLENESQKNIQANSNLLIERLRSRFGDSPERLGDFISFLLQRCFLVAVSTPSQKSAFRVFSVMNSRGLDLQPTDIIKADVIGKLPTTSEQEIYNERWEDMEVDLGRAGFNDLFVYVRMIHAKEKAKRALLEEFRNHVLTQVSDTRTLIEDVLEPYAETLSVLRESHYVAETDADKVNRTLRWLNRIDNSDWVPPAMVFLADHKNEPAYVEWFFRKLERLAAYMHICAKNVNQRIERYALLIAALQQPHDYDNPVRDVELTEDEKSEMRRVLQGDIYTLTARRRNYLILRLDSFVSDGGATYDPTVLTIEHVLPQTVPATSQWLEWWPEPEMRKQWVHRLANLVPLNKRRNSQAQNYDFDKKKNAYFRGRSNVSSYALTSQVLGEDQWTPEVVKERQTDLIAVLADKWEF
ncbi:DUF262 domain-containing HNH endonuclease family protein [Franzmannia qiaohouensis]|uniref:DUF262 domain-containing HNH endonuclease family protein n=1 Tax=Franzmannia qiaohouensis TaxID=1329370 RepID=A0ABU1HJX5_9GAMM|nr:DUF262 domain-containing HNH endonuclease family protein [Halomonas qiaohouensis]MDR5907787.1 DUF262 domain-containing HNH endonuclease family protein [Halomonas qiaohouensis]